MIFIPEELRPELMLRVERLQLLMREAHLNAILVSGATNIFYLAGRVFRGYVYVPAEGNPLYFVMRPQVYAQTEDLVYIRKPEQIPDELGIREIEIPATLGLELDNLTYTETMRLKKVFGSFHMENASVVLGNARMVKTPYEIRLMKADGAHQAAVYHRVTKCYSPDMTDVEFQIEIERVLRREGCLGFVRTNGRMMEINLGSVIAGDNADCPGPYDFTMGGAGTDPSLPVGAVGEILRPGMSVMVDMNGSFNGYQTDMTRVWRIGDLPDIAYKAHDCSRKILRELEKLALPGVKCSEMYDRAVAIVREDNLADYFMGHRQKAGFIGHGVGIELNERPVIMARDHTELKENMTLAIEPKFVIPGVGAVGDENTYRVTASGLENLTVFPEEIQEL